jgi:hypothetical protein
VDDVLALNVLADFRCVADFRSRGFAKDVMKIFRIFEVTVRSCVRPKIRPITCRCLDFSRSLLHVIGRKFGGVV